MEHYRTFPGSVFIGVFQCKSFRHVVIHLRNRAKLPLAAKRIVHDEIDLGSVEGSLSHSLCEGELLLRERRSKRSFRQTAVLLRSDVLDLILWVMERKTERKIGKSKRPIDRECEIQNAENLLFQLIGTDEVMRIILRKTAHTGQSSHFPALLVAVDRPEFREADGKIPVAPRLCGIDLSVVRAVHRLQHVRCILRHHERENILLKMREVPRFFIQARAAGVRRLCKGIAAHFEFPANPVFKFLPDDGTLRPKHREPRTHDFRKDKNTELFPEFPVIVFLRLLEHEKIGLEILLTRKCSNEDTRELLPFLIATKVRTSQ